MLELILPNKQRMWNFHMVTDYKAQALLKGPIVLSLMSIPPVTIPPHQLFQAPYRLSSENKSGYQAFEHAASS